MKERDNADVAILVMCGLAILFVALLAITFFAW